MRAILGSDSRTPIVSYEVVLFDARVVFRSHAHHPILLVLFYFVVLDNSVTSQIFLCIDHDAIFIVLSNMVKRDVRLAADCLDPILALDDIASPHSRPVAPLDLNPGPIHIFDLDP